jgi:hypothetical protein
MKKQTGIWIDTKKAVIVSLTENNHEVKTIPSSIQGRERITGETRAFSRFGFQFLDFAKKKKNRLANEKREYLKTVVAEIKNATEIVLFGPSGMKIELEKFIQDDTVLASRLRAVETADSMTENQMVAWVKNHYQHKK